MSKISIRGSLVGLLIATAVGCAHSANPEAAASAAGPALAAQAAGAENVPSAALHLKLAREELAEAQRLAKDGDKRATIVFARARVDGELALALTTEQSTEQAAKAVIEGAKNEKL